MKEVLPLVLTSEEKIQLVPFSFASIFTQLSCSSGLVTVSSIKMGLPVVLKDNEYP